MRRILLVLTVSLVMAGMLMASALPAVAQGPPTGFSLKALQALLKDADGKNPALRIDVDHECVELKTPGHHSGFPDDSRCQPKT
jgi:hypothetical protein